MSIFKGLVAEELAQPVDPGVRALAAAVAARHGAAARAVLFYGSCLREARLDGLMLDFYLIVDDYRRAYGKAWLAAANRLLPPNVFPIGQDGLVAKYAVLSEADFARLASARTRNVSVWARFAQPSRLVWAADDKARTTVIDAIAGAAPALLAAARPMIDAPVQPLDLWRRAFALTYSAELRAERSGRAPSIVERDAERYLRFTMPALDAAGISATQGADGFVHFAATANHRSRRAGGRAWRRRRLEGKLLTLARLAKATATYAGGIDYLVWKINRHAGTAIALTPWQRRHPILAGVMLLPKLFLSRAVR